MKAIFINGSPRKHFNTAQMLEKAMEGAQSVGAQYELVNLFDYEFTGCRSCFACQMRALRSMHRLKKRIRRSSFRKTCVQPMKQGRLAKNRA